MEILRITQTMVILVGTSFIFLFLSLLMSLFQLLSGRRTTFAKGCTYHFKGCKEVLDQNREAGKFIYNNLNSSSSTSFDFNFCASEITILVHKIVIQVLYKHQMELDEKKKKALDKQLEFLLGQTER